MNAEQHISPFHQGERELQQRLGVRDKMENFGRRVIRDHMPQQHREFYQQLPFILAGHIDDQGWPWASFLYGEEGFIQSADEQSLRMNTRIIAGDPLQYSLNQGRHLGLLGIELPSRRRNRLSTRIANIDDSGIDLKVIQAFGNCPQYIQSRSLQAHQRAQIPEILPVNYFDSEMLELIGNSDTFFVASHYAQEGEFASNGADVSHRGGQPGFVRVDNERQLSIPDYLGNFHFNTLGNFQLNPKAGLLFIDFDNGHVLSVSGRVEILWESDELEHFAGAERLWQFHLEKGVFLKNALPFRWQFKDYSPTTLVTGTWQESETNKQALEQNNRWQNCQVERVVQESEQVKSFYLKPQNDHIARFKAGQFLTVKANINGKEQVRTYTVSSSPEDALYRISVKHEHSDINGAGVFSSWLHQHVKLGDSLQFKVPTGAFFIEPNIERPAVLLAGGIGITPMMSMARHLLQDSIRTRSMRPLILICSARNMAQRSFFQELAALEEQSSGHIHVYWVLSEPEVSAIKGQDYHLQGRISGGFLQALLPIDDYEFFLCGPPGFMQSMYDLCIDLGVADERIQAEAFGPASLTRQTSEQSETEPSPIGVESAIVGFLDSGFEQAWSAEDGNLLEFAEAHGMSPEFGCRSGQCGSCKVPLTKGKVNYAQKPSCAYTDDEVVLCCAVPAKSADRVPVVQIKL